VVTNISGVRKEFVLWPACGSTNHERIASDAALTWGVIGDRIKLVIFLFVI